MPIVIAPTNEDLKIIKVMSDDKTKRHLESLGIAVNATVRLIQSDGGNIIIIAKGVRIALNRDLATKILVA